MSGFTDSAQSKQINQREHNNDALSKRMVLRAQDATTGGWVNISAIPNGDGTSSISTPLGAKSSLNSTMTPLNTGQTFNGTAEVNNFPEVAVSCLTDQNGTLYLEFSPDGTNWDSSLTKAVAANLNEFHRNIKGSRYFRIRFTNTSASNQTFLRIHTSYGSFGPPTTALDSVLQPDTDTTTVRAISDELAIAEGLFAGISIVNKFGVNPDMDTISAPEDVWGGDGLYNGFPAAAGVVEVVSTDVNDTSAGTGARTIRVTGLDADYNIISETLTLNGTSVSSPSVMSFTRIHTATTLTAGSGQVNAGAITVRQVSDPTVIFLVMQVGRNQTNNSVYTVPAGFTAYMRRLHGSVRDGASVTATGFIWTRPFGGVWRNRRPFSMGTGDRLNDVIYGGLVFTEKTDIVIRIDSVSANNSVLTAGYDLILVINT